MLVSSFINSLRSTHCGIVSFEYVIDHEIERPLILLPLRPCKWLRLFLLQMAAIFPVLDLYSCIATKWSRHLGFCITYTALLMKTWRWALQMRLTNWILLEKLTVPRLANKHPALKILHRPLYSTPLGHVKNAQLPNQSYFFKTCFNISLPVCNLWLSCRIWYRSTMSVEINRINYKAW